MTEKSISSSFNLRDNKIDKFKSSTNERLEQLLQSGAPLDEVAKLMGAEEFLTIEKKRGQSETTRFNVEEFINKQITDGTYLELPTNFVLTRETILPPGQGEIIPGSGEGMSKPGVINRTRYLIEVISELAQPYNVVEGTNLPNTMRGMSYRIFLLPNLDKAVLVNDEEKNATYIVHNLSKVEGGWEIFTKLDKNQLRKSQEIDVNFLKYPGDPAQWEERVKELLTSDFIRQEQKVEMPPVPISEKPPDGWQTIAMIASELGVSHGTVKKRFTQEMHLHPELFLQVGKTGHTYCHPDFIESITKELSEVEKAPPGWITNKTLAQSLQSDWKTIKDAAETCRSSNPDWFHMYKKNSGQINEHYHPELVSKITKEFSAIEKAPPLWMTRNALAQSMGNRNSGEAVKKVAELYRSSNPDWFHMYKADGGNQREYYHPELIAKIKEEFFEVEKAPPGWITNGPLAKSLGDAWETVKKVAELYRSSNPDWFHMYKENSGRINEHYHPELVAKIKEEIQKKKL